ncbi:DNA-binding transcriptional regulator SgrR of sgrS sRNA, contains a MarR-type HTH domain and a solute-binding domain [Amphibacillus marinus]|uniref:DNA-binding transcriptional regulator SgrR of sgrS sRNA, contains a MarR-type HTH domain and a solute-binding domain n=1 Tax=Amphibacillus marinus TaxID=872970 RepID=A0A1H8JVW3_9BACI|nr:DNA-binding transcriptional regulator SgrR of sgrS sRNA, contains a MarR-type HTH domain and a solute-binding domain [Amphibacillus marinus]
MWELKEKQGQQATVVVTIPELARLLHCTERHVKNIIKKMQDNKWIEWYSGLGRGNRSQIIFVCTLEQVVKTEAKRLVLEKSIEQALSFLQKYQTDHSFLTRATFLDFILSYVDQEDTDHLRFPSYRPLPILDPLRVDRRTENHFMSYLYDTLVQFQSGSQEVRPGIAHTWAVNKSFTKWTLYIRKAVYFHHQERVTAADVCRCIQLHQHDNASPYHWVFEHLDSIASINELTVKLRFNKPMPFLLACLTTLAGAIFIKDQAGKMVGTGPYQLIENTEQKLNLAVHNNYYHTRPFLDQITLYFFPSLYDNTDIDVKAKYANLNFYHYPYKHEQRDFQAYTHIDHGSKLLTFNAQAGPLAKNEQLRQAIISAVQPAELIKQLGGNRYLTASRMRRELEQHEKTRKCLPDTKHLIEASQYQGEVLTLACYQGAGNEQDANWICARLNKIGVRVQLKVFDYQNFFQQQLHQYDMLLGEQIAHDHPLISYFKAFLGSQSLLTHHLPPTLKGQVENCLTTVRQPNEALGLLDELEEKVSAKFYGMYLYRLNQYAIYPSYFKNIHINALGWLDFKAVWFDQEDMNF